MHRSHGLQGSLKRRYKHPSPTSINGYHTAKKLLSQSPAKRPTFAFADESGYTLAFANRIAHSGLHAETGAVSDGGAITTLGAFCAVRKPCVARCQNGVLCRFGILAGRCSRRTQKTFGTAMRLCVSLSRRRRGPAGLRNLFLLLSELWLVHPALRTLCVYEVGVVSLPSVRFTCCRNTRRPLVKMAHLLFSCGQVIIIDSSGAKCVPFFLEQQQFTPNSPGPP